MALTPETTSFALAGYNVSPVSTSALKGVHLVGSAPVSGHAGPIAKLKGFVDLPTTQSELTQPPPAPPFKGPFL